MKAEAKTKVKVVGKTLGGKEIGYRDIGHSRYLEAAFKTGGQLPDELKGNWTDPMSLTKEIKSFLIKEKLEAEAKEAAKKSKAAKA